MASQVPLTTRPPEVIDLGDVALVRSGDVSPEAVYKAVDASREHLEPWMAWADGYDGASAREFAVIAEQGWEDDAEYVYALVDPDGQVVGAIGLHRRIGTSGLEIGYWVHADRQGRGLVTRAASALVDAAFAMEGIDHVEIHHDEANLRSAGVPRRLGFTKVARVRREPEAPGCVGVGLIWRLTREEAEAR